MSTVLILSPVLKGSGNYASVCRLRGNFEKHGRQTCLESPNQFLDGGTDLRTYVNDHNIGLVLGIHAYKAGQLLPGLPVPYILVLGGTDLNIDSGNENKMRVMTEAVSKAGHIIGFGESMLDKFFLLWPCFDKKKTSIIPQAVKVEPSDFKIKEYIRNNILKPSDSLQPSHHQPESHDSEVGSHDKNIDDEDMKIFIFAGGIRPVKNQLFLVKEFSDWREKNNRLECFMLFVGPQMDPGYFEEFNRAIKGLPGVIHIPGREAPDTHAAIRDSFALVNSSDSEGMSLAILEAMCLDTPVVVRDIAGNTAVVTDGSTGLVYRTKEEFLEKIELLLGDKTVVEKITQNARDYVLQHHSLEMEEMAYITAVNSLQSKPAL